MSQQALRAATPQPADVVTAKERALWLLGQLVPDSGVSNIPLAFGGAGRLRWWPLQAAVSQLLRRHEVLRTTYHEYDGNLRRSVLSADEAVLDVEIIQADAGELDAKLTAFAAVPFEPAGDLLLRAGLFLCPSGDVFCLVAHHSVFDGRSVPIATKELVERAEVPAPAHRDPAPEAVEYWRGMLADVDPTGSALAIGDEPPVTSDLRCGR